MVTLRARLVFDVLMPLMRGKRRYDPMMNAESLRASARTPAPVPEKSGAMLITEGECQGRPLYHLTPKAGQPSQTLFYLHGGAFVNPITGYHWKLLTDLCTHLDADIWVPLYPLAPDTAIDGMMSVIESIYNDTLGRTPCGLIGDSAGAYLALVLAQRLRDRDGPKANNPALVLISPCLDLTLSDPRSRAIDRRDPMLDLAGIKQVLALAAAPLAVDDPRLSPLLMGLADLPPVLALAGSRDILYPDTSRLAEAIRTAGGRIKVFDAPGMAHVWPLLPVPEARAARRAIIDFLRSPGDLAPAAG